MLLLLFATSAHPSPEGFEPVRESDGCAIAMRPESHPEGAAMRADCRWPDVDPERLIALIDRYDRYSEFVFPISEARIERREPDRTLVYQRQHLPGMADREVLLWMQRSETSDRVRVSWLAANDQPLALSPGAIRTPRNTGYWEVVRDPAGGATVVHEIAMDAGGVIPRWIINLVRTRAFARIMRDVRIFPGGQRPPGPPTVEERLPAAPSPPGAHAP